MTQSTGEWLKTHKQEAALGAGGIVVAIALYAKSKKKAGPAPAVATTTTTAPYYAMPGTTVATTTGTDIYNGLENQILGLQQSVLGMAATGRKKATTAGTTTKTAPTPPAHQGTGSTGPRQTPSPTIAYLNGQADFVLGGFTATGKYTGFNASHGAPILATWTGNGTPTLLGNAPANAKNVTLYTPTGTPLTYIGNHTQGPTSVGWSNGYTGQLP